MKIAIIDDHEHVIEYLIEVLKTCCGNGLNIVSSRSLYEGLTLINEHCPDLVFLDLHHPSGSSFEILQQCVHKDFKPVLITADSELTLGQDLKNKYTVLYKPIDPAEIQRILDEIR